MENEKIKELIIEIFNNSSNIKDDINKIAAEHAEGFPSILKKLCTEEFLLHRAIEKGQEEVVMYLCSYCADINSISPVHGSVLSVASRYGYECIIDVLLCNGATVPKPPLNPCDDKSDDDENIGSFTHCPTLQSINSGFLNVLKLLIEASKEYYTDVSVCKVVLSWACVAGHPDIFQYLWSTLTDLVDDREGLNNFIKENLLSICLKYGHQTLLKEFLSHGLTFTQQLIEDYTDVFGRFLESFAKEEIPSSYDKRTSMALEVVCDWSNKGLHAVSNKWLTPYADTLIQLNLDDNLMTSLPDCVPWSLCCLQTFSARSCQLMQLPEYEGPVKCIKLSKMDVSENHLSVLPVSIFLLPALTNLDISHNRLSALHCDIVNEEEEDAEVPKLIDWTCIKLENLDASNNRLTKISPGIRSCHKLKCLNLAKNKLTSFIQPWRCPLTLLNLADNGLKSLPEGFADCWSDSLTSLLLSHNSLTEITQTICRLESLTELRLSYNRISCLPNPDWWKCKYLRVLDLTKNSLSSLQIVRHSSTGIPLLPLFKIGRSDVGSGIELPNIFSNALEVLKFGRNKITHIPSDISKFSTLCHLDLSHNHDIKELPNSLCELKFLDSLVLDGISFTDKNLQRIIQKHALYTKMVQAYLGIKHRKRFACNKIKLMIVGNQGNGKSSLSLALRGLEGNSSEAGKHVGKAVNIVKWKMQSSIKETILQKTPRRPLTLQIWDFSGSKDCRICHKIFLSSQAVYLVVFDLRTGRPGADSLNTWLSDIQAHAPDARVIIVGTFLDLVSEGPTQILLLKKYILNKYSCDKGYPKIEKVVDICNVGRRKEGFEALRKDIYELAISVKVRDTFGWENFVGKMIPFDYKLLGKAVKAKAIEITRNNSWPVLNSQQFREIVSGLGETSINTSEELTLAVEFLNSRGYLFHFNSSLHGLTNLYFINPQWLAETLTKFFMLPEMNRYIRNGTIDIKDIQSLMFKEFSGNNIEDYIDLLETFEIALRLDNNRLLLPSKLPAERPPYWRFFDSAYSQGGSGLTNVDVDKKPRGCSVRFYRMRAVPSGLWSRLVVQVCSLLSPEGTGHLLTWCRGSNQSRGSDMSDSSSTLLMQRGSTFCSSAGLVCERPRASYWQEGITVDYGTSVLMIESAGSYFSREKTTLHDLHLDDNNDDNVDDDDDVLCGLMVCIHSAHSVFMHDTLLAFTTDLLHSLVDQWFPGLLDDEAMTEYIACPGCLERDFRDTTSTLNAITWFPLIECANRVVDEQPYNFISQCEGGMICERCDINKMIPLCDLVPDLLLLDVPSELHVAQCEDLSFDTAKGAVGRGGEGCVYEGTYMGKKVAVKQSMIIDKRPSAQVTQLKSSAAAAAGIASAAAVTADTAVSVRSHDSCSSSRSNSSCRNHNIFSDSIELKAGGSSSESAYDSEETGRFWKTKTLQAFHSYRQEVCAMVQLSHSCIVSILAVNPQRLVYAMNFCPLGSLRKIIETRGGRLSARSCGRGTLVLEKFLTFKIIYQIASALQYLHSLKLVYKDMKPDNLLVSSLDAQDSVNIKLADYGLARRITHQGLMGLEGTPGYIAPEIRQNKPYNEKVDIFALSMVMFEFSNGRNCFPDLSAVVVNKKLQDGVRPEFSAEDEVMEKFPELVTLIRSCWLNDPAMRPSAFQICTTLKNLSFIAIEKRLTLQDIAIKGSLSTVCSYYQKGDDIGRYVRMLTLFEGRYYYHMFNTAMSLFKISNECCHLWNPSENNQVTCSAVVERYLVIGAMNGSLMLYSSLTVSGGFKLLDHNTDLQGLPDNIKPFCIPLFIKPISKASLSFMVGYGHSQLCIYNIEEIDSNQAKLQLQSSVYLSDPMADKVLAATCAVLVEMNLSDVATSEVWIGCGGNIGVIQLNDAQQKQEIINVFYKSYTIAALVNYRDQVWCLGRRCNLIIELDVESREILCVIDCTIVDSPKLQSLSCFDWKIQYDCLMLAQNVVTTGKQPENAKEDKKMLRDSMHAVRSRNEGQVDEMGEVQMRGRDLNQHRGNRVGLYVDKNMMEGWGDKDTPIDNRCVIPSELNSNLSEADILKKEMQDVNETVKIVRESLESSRSSNNDQGCEEFKGKFIKSTRGNGSTKAINRSTIRRKLSCKPNQTKNRSGIKVQKDASKSNETSSCLSSSLCYVNDCLWIGTRDGRILVVNVTPNNKHSVPHGNLVAVLNTGIKEGKVGNLQCVAENRMFSTVCYLTGKQKTLPNDTKQPLCASASLNLSSSSIFYPLSSSSSSANKSESETEKCDVIMWSAFGLDEFMQIEKSFDIGI